MTLLTDYFAENEDQALHRIWGEANKPAFQEKMQELLRALEEASGAVVQYGGGTCRRAELLSEIWAFHSKVQSLANMIAPSDS